jgi:hypothetical protein
VGLVTDEVKNVNNTNDAKKKLEKKSQEDPFFFYNGNDVDLV